MFVHDGPIAIMYRICCDLANFKIYGDLFFLVGKYIADVIIYSGAKHLFNPSGILESLFSLPFLMFCSFFWGAKNRRPRGRGAISAAGLDATLRLLKPQDVEQCAEFVCVVKWGKVSRKA